MNRNCYVILHIRPGPPYPEPTKSFQIATDSRFELSSDMWIEKLDTELAKRIQRACEPANYNIYSDVWDRHLYAFVRKIPAQESARYQGLEDLYTIIALSRLIHPTSTGERYCAKIFSQPETDPPIQAIQSGVYVQMSCLGTLPEIGCLLTMALSYGNCCRGCRPLSQCIVASIELSGITSKRCGLTI
jgi:hypothetical protein